MNFLQVLVSVDSLLNGNEPNNLVRIKCNNFMLKLDYCMLKLDLAPNRSVQPLLFSSSLLLRYFLSGIFQFGSTLIDLKLP